VVVLAAAAPLVIAAIVAAGSQRHHYWTAALDQAAGAPLVGGGAGSFGRHWLATRDVAFAARDAHSLYLETLAELGLAGLALVALVLVPPLLLARRAPAAAAALAVFGVHAAFDWDWEMPAATLAAIFCAVALTTRDESRVLLTSASRLAAAGSLVVLALVALPPFVGHAALAASDDALLRGRADDALARAARAERLLPWSPEPHLSEASIRRTRGETGAARAAARRAIAHDETDTRLWRLLAELSGGAERRRALERADELDPLGAPARP
jgi:hypothetical protein